MGSNLLIFNEQISGLKLNTRFFLRFILHTYKKRPKGKKCMYIYLFVNEITCILQM